MRRILLGFLLATLGLFDVAAATAIPRQRTDPPDTTGLRDKPIVGRAVPCDSGRIGLFECRNVELLAYLPKSAIGGATG